MFACAAHSMFSALPILCRCADFLTLSVTPGGAPDGRLPGATNQLPLQGKFP